ncbi:hypothetical protein SKAU_G00186700 [Synaphobranchus kaupii]|uniref:DUF4706 domain-containing protein n=1 Tax=Synaphobranchus kaupii TaxID=118154 RepID=A0A9Q1FCR2_SYNKA|nr:hypothetical protein SKAU_G00186700 [Synaphobranchus kaupii]
MIVLDSQPFSLVEDIGFKAFVNKLNPTYTIPTRKALKLMVDKRYDEAKEKAMAEVQDAEYVSLTADMWTSINMDSYLGVTCHYITKETKLATVLLGVTRFPQSHTAVNIKEAQNVLIESWGISMEKIHCLATDNAANMLASAQLLRREAVGAALANLNSDVSPLSSSDYEKIIQCLGVLAPFKYATAEMSEEKRVSASKLIPIVRMIQHKVSEKTKLMTQESSRQLGVHLQQELHARCSGIETVRVLAMAALLDPRFKVLVFGNASLMKDAEKNLTAECASLIRSSTDHQLTTQDNPAAQATVSSAPTDGENLWDLLDIRVSEAQRDTAIDNGMMDPQIRARYAMHRVDREEVVCYPKLLIQTGQKIVHFGEEDITWQDEHSAPFSWETKSQLDFSLSSTAAPEQSSSSVQSESKPNKISQSSQLAKVSQGVKVSNGESLGRKEEESSFWKISAERSRLEGEKADFHSITPSQVKSLEKREKPLPSYLRQESAPREAEEQPRVTKPRAPRPPAPPPPVPISAPPASISLTPAAPISVSSTVAGWERAQSTLPSVNTLDDVFTPGPPAKSPAWPGGSPRESDMAESPLAGSPTFAQFNTSNNILKTGFDFLDNW